MRGSESLQQLTRLRGIVARAGGIAPVFGLKAGITVLNFGLVTLAARALQLDAFGTYSLLFSAAGLLGITATLGQQVLVMRFWSEYLSQGRADLLKGSLIFSATACLIGCMAFGLPFYFWCAAVHGGHVALAVVGYMAALALVMTTAHLVRTAIGVAVGDGSANFLLAFPGALYLGFCLAVGVRAELGTLFSTMAAGGLLAIVIHFHALRRAVAAKCPAFAAARPAFDIAQWSGRSVRLWMSNALEAANQYLDVLLIGVLLDPVAAGAWFVLTRVANVISVATDAIHMFSTRHIPELYFRKDRVRLDGILDTVAWVSLIVIFASIVAIVVAGGWVLAIFNSAYVGYHGLLIVLSLGAAAAAAAGPSGSLLMLTGHEGRYLAIIGGAVLLRIAAFAVLIPLFGITGAAVAVALSLAAMTLLLRHAARDCTGIDASILRIRPARSPASSLPAESQG